MSALSITETADEKYDFSARVDALRCHSTDWLNEHIKDLRREQQQLWLEELAALRVLDDRVALPVFPEPSVSARTNKSNLKVARELESLPAIADAAHSGAISKDQLEPLVEIAGPETDGEWSLRGTRMAVGDLQRMARQLQKVSAADAEARQRARSLRVWKDPVSGMMNVRGAFADVDGVLVDKVLDHMAERMRPAKGLPWDSLEHRKADAFADLCRNYAQVEPTGKFRYEIVNLYDPNARSYGPSVDGIPIAEETLAALLPNAKVRDCVPDENGVMRTVGKVRQALPKDIERHIRRRDGNACRTPGCNGTWRLEIHHMQEISEFGESWDVTKLVLVCGPCHHRLAPHGPYRLIGNAEEPDGLRLVHRDDLARDGPGP